eukprot:10068651-Alexandrium_andersonii.AAC.1
MLGPELTLTRGQSDPLGVPTYELYVMFANIPKLRASSKGTATKACNSFRHVRQGKHRGSVF